MPKKRAKEAAAAGAGAPADDDKAVIDLRMDSSTPEAPREVQPAASGGFQTPCTITGVMAGLSGGTLGYVFGFGGYWIKNRLGGQWKASLAEGWGSFKTFAIMGGIYAAVSCFMQRLRQKQDAWNGAASGCATGLALGYKQGPMGALQSCAMLGLFSFFVDGMGGGEAQAAGAQAAAAALGHSSSQAGSGSTSGSSSGGFGPSSSSGGGSRRHQQRSPVELLLSHAVPLLTAVAPCAFPGLTGSIDGESGVAGCRVVRRR